MATSPSLLIASLSGRSLAASAARGGMSTVVLDLFGDGDTRRLATRVGTVRARDGWSGFDPEDLLRQARDLAPGVPLLPGSGFEHAPDLLRELAKGRRLLGNEPEVIRRVKDPDGLAALLAECGYPHPDTTRTPPRDISNWLLKQAGASGGAHVRDARAPLPDTVRDYYQRRVAGIPHSVTFLANGRQACMLGFNRQWTAEVGQARHCFAGALGPVAVPVKVARDIAGRIDRLVGAAGLVGLNGLDFMLDGDDYQVLEINPRPCATLDLYDPDHPVGLVPLHIVACGGRLPDTVQLPKQVRAATLVIALADCMVGTKLVFPDWCSDQPAPGSRLIAGAPVCMVHAAGHDAGVTQRLLDARLQWLLGQLRARAA